MLNKIMTLKQAVMVQAIAIAFGAALVTPGVSSTVHAQSNATGTIFGQVPAGTGLTILLENSVTNVHRMIAGAESEQITGKVAILLRLVLLA